MFKLVVLFCVLAAASAKPGALLAPLTYAASPLYAAPATTTISHQASSVIHPSPVVYSSPYYTHFLKKRSAPFYTAFPYYSPSVYSSPLIASTYAATPLVHTTPVLHTAPLAYTSAHLIKKRSPGIAYSTFGHLTPAYTPLLHTPYAALPHAATPIIQHPGLVTYPTHFIKKRSAPLVLSPYLAPTSYSHQSRVDIHSSPLFSAYTTPLAYHAPLTHIY